MILIAILKGKVIGPTFFWVRPEDSDMLKYEEIVVEDFLFF